MNQALAQTIALNNPPFVTVIVVPPEGFVNETFSIYVTAGDTDGYLTGATVTMNGLDVSSEFDKINSTTWLYDYVPSTAAEYVVVCTVYDNSGATATDSATFQVTDPVYSIRPIELHDDLLKLTPWEDFDFWANVKGSDGKDYYVDLSLISRADTSKSKVKLDNEPAPEYFNGTHNIIEEKPLVRTMVESPLTVQKSPDLVIYSLKQGFRERLKTRWVTVEFTFQPPDLHIVRASSGSSQIELRFHTRGLPLWYNQGAPVYLDSLGESMGYEIFSNVEGTLVNNGNSVQLNGYGVMEHWWSDRWNHESVMRMDWEFFNFDELYGLVTLLDGYTDGGVYLMKEQQYLTIDSFSVEYGNWAYNLEQRYYVPTEVSVSASTASGTLEVYGQVEGLQQVGFLHEPYYNICGIRMSGTFTYSNGTAMTLTNGSGWGQIITRWHM
jgi:hypothetical protein